MLFSIVAAPIDISTSSVGGFPSLCTLPSIIVCGFFYDSYSDWCEMISHCSFVKNLKKNRYMYIKEINPEYSLEGLILKCQYFDQYSDAKSQLIRKDPDSGKDQGQEEKRITEDEMV